MLRSSAELPSEISPHILPVAEGPASWTSSQGNDTDGVGHLQMLDEDEDEDEEDEDDDEEDDDDDDDDEDEDEDPDMQDSDRDTTDNFEQDYDEGHEHVSPWNDSFIPQSSGLYYQQITNALFAVFLSLLTG